MLTTGGEAILMHVLFVFQGNWFSSEENLYFISAENKIMAARKLF